MALVAWRLFYCSDIYIALCISGPVLFGSRFTNSIHVQALCLTYVYVINRHICKQLYKISTFVYIYLRIFFLASHGEPKIQEAFGITRKELRTLAKEHIVTVTWFKEKLYQNNVALL